MSNKNSHIDPQRKRNNLSRRQLETIRLTAVRRVLNGETPMQVIQELGYHHSCIYEWLNIYKKKGEAGLLSRPISGRPRRNMLKPAPEQVTNIQHNPTPTFSVPDNIDQWVTLLYQSILDQNYPLSTFVTALCHYFESSTIIIPNLRMPSSPIRPFNSATSLQELISRNKAVIHDWWCDNPFLKALTQPGDLLTLSEILPTKTWQDNEFCRMLQQANGPNKVCVAGFCFAGPDETLCGLFSVNTTAQKTFSAQDRQLLQQLHVHLETAMKLVVERWRSTYTVKALKDAIDNLEIAALVLDGNGVVVEHSSTAEEMLDCNPDISLTNQRVNFHQDGWQTQFDRAINRAIAWRQAPIGDKPIEAIRLADPARNGPGLLVQAITPPTMTIPHSIAVSPHAVVYISDPTKPHSVPYSKLIERLFELSTREAQLTMLLTEGHSLAEAAKNMNITQATARTYLQHIYEKIGVNRQQDLLLRVMKSVALLA